ncbi:MAG TPA: hypothetical protein PLC80_00975 [Draconibacterium sp.]|nr:hypothetical protein [Draconibacterium sp.]
MKKLLLTLSIVLLIIYVCVAKEKTQIHKSNNIVLQLDTAIFKVSDTIVISTIKLDEIKTFINDSTNYKVVLDSLKQELASVKLKSSNDRKSLLISQNLLYFLAALFLTLIILYVMDKRKRKDEILFVLTGKKRNKEMHPLIEWESGIIEKAVEKAKKQPDDPNVTSIKSEFENTIKDLQKRIATLEDFNRKEPKGDLNQVKEHTKAAASEPSSRTLYADAIINNVLNKVTEQPNADTVYELLLKTPTDKTATLTVYAEAFRRVLKNADFIDGCEKQRVNKSPINLDVEKGEAQLQDDGKWQIVKKANVKFV